MTMIYDNFEEFADYMQFKDKDSFYFVQIIQRKKDGNDVRVASGYRRIKQFYFFSKKQLLKEKNRIIDLCNNNNARAYISIVQKNAREVALMTINKLSSLLLDNIAEQGMSTWDSCCGKNRAKGTPSIFLIDVDDVNRLSDVKEVLMSLDNPPEIKLELRTPNGYHVLVSKFNRLEFQEKCRERGFEFDVQKDNLTLLYYNTRESIK